MKFADVERKSQFSSKLKNFAEGIGASFSTNNFGKAELILNNASTKEDRQKLLDKFFRVICLQVNFLQEFGNPYCEEFVSLKSRNTILFCGSCLLTKIDATVNQLLFACEKFHEVPEGLVVKNFSCHKPVVLNRIVVITRRVWIWLHVCLENSFFRTSLLEV